MWNPFKTRVVFSVPEVDSLWESREPNPFNRIRVRVLEVQEGFVRYCLAKYKDSPYRMYLSCSLEAFHSIYLEVSQEETK